MRIKILVTCILLALAKPYAEFQNFAQLGAGLGAMDVGGGFNFKLGYGYQFERLPILFTATPIHATWIAGEPDPRYRMDELNNGSERCRDLSNGQFAKSEKCDPPLNSYWGIETDLSWRFSLPPELGERKIFFGPGYRLGAGESPYAVLGLISNPRSAGYNIELRVGSAYVSLGAAFMLGFNINSAN